MRIIIDFTAFMPLSTGVDTYMKQLVLSLGVVDSVNEYLICLNVEDRDLFDGCLPANFTCRSVCARPRPVRLFFQQVLLPAISVVWRADVVHSPAFIMPFLKGYARHVLTIHDMTSFSHPECHNALRRSKLYLTLVRASMRRADTIVVPSIASKEAILELMPEVNTNNIHVTPLGISKDFCLQQPQAVAKSITRLGLPEPYILFLGTVEPRKNLSALVKSYERLLKEGAIDENLVIVGKMGWGYEELLEQINVPLLKDKIHLAGYLDQEDLPAVYAGARLFVYPSLFEGFGFPPLEAMACGVPTISTLSSSLTENLAGVAELVPPGNTEALAAAIKHLLNDDRLWRERREKGVQHASNYRWERTAKDTLASYLATAP